MKKICVWILVCAALAGCGLRDSVAEDKSAQEEQLKAMIESQHAEISTRYLASADAFNRLADLMAENSDVVQLYCDENVAYVETRSSIYYEDENVELAAPYFELCRFESKVVASHLGAAGIVFPHHLDELGPLFVSGRLARRVLNVNSLEDCAEVSLAEEWGSCQQPISEPWYAYFSWRPICPDGPGPKDRC